MPDPTPAFTPDDAVASIGAVGKSLLGTWARTANDALWGCLGDGGEAGACSVLARKAADDRCKSSPMAYAQALPEPEGLPVHHLAAADWCERRDHGQRINGVEVFRSGTWNGTKYVAADLDSMVAAFGAVGFRPPVKLGHTDETGAPAYGWVANLRREGDRLLADFEDMPDETHKAITEGRYDAVSAEVFFNLNRDGKKYPRVLSAVALLGAQVPAVGDLKSLRASLASFAATAAPETFATYTLKREPPMPDPIVNPDAAALAAELAESKAEIARLTQVVNDKPADDTAVRLAAMAEEMAELRANSAATKEAHRLSEVAGKAAKCKVPSMRPHVAALYDLASRGDAATRKVTFALSDGEAKPTDAMAVVDDLVERLNKVVSHGLLREHSSTADLDGAEADANPGAEIDRLTKKRQAAKGESYSVAMAAVIADPANAAVAHRYALRAN